MTSLRARLQAHRADLIYSLDRVTGKDAWCANDCATLLRRVDRWLRMSDDRLSLSAGDLTLWGPAIDDACSRAAWMADEAERNPVRLEEAA